MSFASDGAQGDPCQKCENEFSRPIVTGVVLSMGVKKIQGFGHHCRNDDDLFHKGLTWSGRLA